MFLRLKFLRQIFSLLSLLVSISIWFILSLVFVLAVSLWYRQQTRQAPLIWGVSWSSKQAEFFDLDNQALDEMLDQIPFQRLQLMSYWDLIESENNLYDFEELDQQFAIAKNHNLQVSLQLGIHQARWPYCHYPNWSNQLNKAKLKTELRAYLNLIIKRYDQQINLKQYQLEPEIFKAQAADCQQLLTKEDLEELYEFVDNLTEKDIALSRPNNRPVLRKQKPAPSSFGLEIKAFASSPSRWQTLNPFKTPARWYSFSAGNLQLWHSQSHVFIRNLIAEPFALQKQTSDKLFDDWQPDNLQKRLNYAVATKIPIIDLSGAEWWMWRYKQADRQPLATIKQAVISNF